MDAKGLLLLRNAALVDANARERRTGIEVLIDDDTIREVSDRPIRSAGASTIDLGGRTLMPGLIDAHVHVIGVTTDLAALARIPPYLVAAQAKGILEGMLARGFTTARDAGGAEWSIAEAVRRGHFRGPRLYVAGLALAQTGGQGDVRTRVEEDLGCPCCNAMRSLCRVVDGVDEVRKAVRDELRKGADHIKVMASGGMVSRVPIHQAHYAVAELETMVEEATAAGTYVMAHAYESYAIGRCVNAGVRSIEHGNLIDHATAKLMAERGTYMVPTMTVYEGYYRHGADLGFAPNVTARFAELGKLAVTGLDRVHSAGVKIGHGSDLEGILHPYQAREFALKAQVMSPWEVIVAATATNAEMMGLKGKIGIVAPGALADLIVVDGDPLANLDLLAGQGEHLSLIMQAGTIYKNTL
ncbi:MAG: amidohydrolase family protein [Dongiaceae bacterium]